MLLGFFAFVQYENTLVCHDSSKVVIPWQSCIILTDILVYQYFSYLKGIDIVSMSETGRP